MKACKMKKWLSAFLKDEEGASAIEYVLIVTMVALLLVTLTPEVQGAITGIFNQIIAALTPTTGG